jgi:hypothetical protein
VTAQELIDQQPVLDAQLKKVGPVQFVRELIMKIGGAHLQSKGTAKPTAPKLATLFIYEDESGAKVKISVINELLATGRNRYQLEIEPTEES